MTPQEEARIVAKVRQQIMSELQRAGVLVPESHDARMEAVSKAILKGDHAEVKRILGGKR